MSDGRKQATFKLAISKIKVKKDFIRGSRDGGINVFYEYASERLVRGGHPSEDRNNLRLHHDFHLNNLKLQEARRSALLRMAKLIDFSAI